MDKDILKDLDKLPKRDLFAIRIMCIVKKIPRNKRFIASLFLDVLLLWVKAIDLLDDLFPYDPMFYNGNKTA